MMPPRPNPAPLSETERPSSLLPNAKIAYHLRRADEWKRAYTAGKRDPLAEDSLEYCLIAELSATVRALQQRNEELQTRMAALDPNHILRDGSVPK